MKRISVIGIVMCEDEREHTTYVYYPDQEYIPDECLMGECEHHYWITEDGKPPRDDDSCLCKKRKYKKEV